MEPDFLIRAVAGFADRMLNSGRACNSPLFADTPGAFESGERFRLLSGARAPFLLSNLAAQQPFFRLLMGLTHLTGNGRYADAARSALALVFDEFSDSHGLLIWGGHSAIALPMEVPAFEGAKGLVHELKAVYPDYRTMWDVNRGATKRFIEAFWNAHILDWGSLDFDRHGRYGAAAGPGWEATFTPGSVFFWGRGLTFVNAGSELYYAAAMLSVLSGDPRPLVWAERLASRYIATRQIGVGISGYQFSQSRTAWCNGPGVRGDRAQHQIAPHIPEGHLVFEGTLFHPVPAVQRCQLSLSCQLQDSGITFRTWAIDELLAWVDAAYRREDNLFIPMLTDGYLLDGFRLRSSGYFGCAGTVLAGRFAGPDFLWLYAMAYRIAPDARLWRIIQWIAKGNGLCDLTGSSAWEPPSCDYRLAFAFLELYFATGCRGFLCSAEFVARQLVLLHFRDGWSVDQGVRSCTGSEPLAVLAVAATLVGRPETVPSCLT